MEDNPESGSDIGCNDTEAARLHYLAHPRYRTLLVLASDVDNRGSIAQRTHSDLQRTILNYMMENSSYVLLY